MVETLSRMEDATFWWVAFPSNDIFLQLCSYTTHLVFYCSTLKTCIFHLSYSKRCTDAQLHDGNPFALALSWRPTRLLRLGATVSSQILIPYALTMLLNTFPSLTLQFSLLLNKIPEIWLSEDLFNSRIHFAVHAFHQFSSTSSHLFLQSLKIQLHGKHPVYVPSRIR